MQSGTYILKIHPSKKLFVSSHLTKISIKITAKSYSSDDLSQTRNYKLLQHWQSNI